MDDPFGFGDTNTWTPQSGGAAPITQQTHDVRISVSANHFQPANPAQPQPQQPVTQPQQVQYPPQQQQQHQAPLANNAAAAAAYYAATVGQNGVNDSKATSGSPAYSAVHRSSEAKSSSLNSSPSTPNVSATSSSSSSSSSRPSFPSSSSSTAILHIPPPASDIPQNWSIFPPDSNAAIQVSDPEKRGSGMSEFIVYKVSMTISVGSITQSHTTVIRRYSDFAWLHEQLSMKYRGYLIPPIPPKQNFGRFETDFIEDRRRSLEHFIVRLVNHVHLKHTSELALFMTGTEPQLTAAKSGKSGEKSGNKPAAGKGGISGFFSSISNSIGGNAKSATATPEDHACERMSEYAQQLENQLGGVYGNIDSLVKKNKSLAKSWFEFGLSCTVVGQSEGSAPMNQPALATIFAQVGTTSDKLSVMYSNEADQENAVLREPVRDYIRLAEAVKDMMRARQGANAAFFAAKERVDSSKSKLQQALSTGGKNDRVAGAERAVKDAERDLEVKQRELTEITTRSLYEFEQFKAQKNVEMRKMVISFVKLQIEHSKKVQQAWEQILPELENAR